jgi:Sec-independent protein translocase protein TatA
MDILGIGIPEIIFILVIILIVMGPEDMMKMGRSLGKIVRRVLLSDTWQAIRRTSQELREIPTRLVREAGLDELQEFQNELKADVESIGNVQNELKEEVEQIKRELPKEKIDLGIEAWTKPAPQSEEEKEPQSPPSEPQES